MTGDGRDSYREKHVRDITDKRRKAHFRECRKNSRIDKFGVAVTMLYISTFYFAFACRICSLHNWALPS